MTSRPDDETKYEPKAPGSFQRGPNRVQHWVGEGSPFPPASGRYHLFLNYGCGWSHQCMLLRSLKGLEEVVSMSHVGVSRLGQMGTDTYQGWSVPYDPTGNGFQSAFDIYNHVSSYGRSQLTIPILFDKESRQGVSNDPAHILLLFNSAFNEWAGKPHDDFYPPNMQQEIEAINDVVFPGINDGVYRCWFASTPEAYEEGFAGLSTALRVLEERLEAGPFLCGSVLSLADVRAFPHLFRFDVIYHELMLRDPKGPLLSERFPRILEWLKRVHELPGVAEVCDLQVATRFYFSNDKMSLEDVNKRYNDFKLPWMPSLEELAAKRRSDGLPEHYLEPLP
mmetsp:Transcript_23335/g.51282  ORF Transcript_23335/g.51282 Transcript_23335/m.51282 type:complete len:337 (+) Transcript_23335:183-1193(+)